MAYPERFNAIRPKWLSGTRSRLLKRTALLIMFTVLGAELAYEITSVRQQRVERARLVGIANRQIDRGLSLGIEARDVLHTLSLGKSPACSAADLNFIRGTIVGSTHIWDAGRERDGKILCSVLEGSISPVFSAGPPTATIGGNEIWLYPWPLTPPRHQGFILDSGGSWVVLDQEILDRVDGAEGESTTTYLHDKKHNAIIRSIGGVPALSVAEIEASKPLERNGVLYQPLCVERSAICAVVSEQRSSLQERNKLVLYLGTVIGGLFGTSLSFGLFVLDNRLRTIEMRLRRAIRSGGLALVYQPIVDLETEEIVGAEALVRWKTEAGDFVPPEVFIGIAERKGFIGEITRVVVNLIMKEMGEHLSTSGFRITINISSSDLIDPNFLTELDRRLDSARIPRSNIGLELTERSTADHTLVAQAIARTREAGHEVYIDDFGTGYSSLAYLHELRVDYIKIDRVFTQMIGTESVAASVVPQILSMALQLHLKVVVEGIETQTQAEYFRQNTVGFRGQGWLYSRPVDASALRRLIRVGQLQT